MMSRAAMMLGTAALVAADDVLNHPFNKWTVSAVNFTVSVDRDITDFDLAGQNVFASTVLTRVAGAADRYGMEIYNIEAHPELLSHTQFNARFYSTDKDKDGETVVITDVENVARQFYALANEAQWEKYEDEQYKAWEIKNAADKKFELYDRKLYTNPPTPIPEVVEPTAAEIEAEEKIENLGLHFNYPALIFAEIDCKRTNYDYPNLPEWAKFAEFENPSFHAQCHDDDSLSWVAVFGLYCGVTVVLGMFVFLFILLCSGSNQGKPAPSDEPTF